jgi:hypothetical protein
VTDVCSSCGLTCEQASRFCPYCGAPQTEVEPKADGGANGRSLTQPAGALPDEDLTEPASTGLTPDGTLDPAEGTPEAEPDTRSARRVRFGAVAAVTVIAVAVGAGAFLGEQIGSSGKNSHASTGKTSAVTSASDIRETVPRASVTSLVGCWTSPPEYARQGIVVWPTGDGRITYFIKGLAAPLHVDFEGLDVIRPGKATAIVTNVATAGRQIDLQPVSSGTQINFAFLPTQQFGRAFQVSNPAVPGVTSIIYYYTSRPPANTDTQACVR